jgi:hypothetical protein
MSFNKRSLSSSSLPQYQPLRSDASCSSSRFPYYYFLLIVVIFVIVALPPIFFSSITAILQAANLSQIIHGAIREAHSLPEPKLQSTYPFASINGPVIHQNFPDPSAIKVGDVWHAFATNNKDGPNVQVASSHNFDSWTYLDKDALPDAGPWSTGKGIWAPDVVQLVREPDAHVHHSLQQT